MINITVSGETGDGKSTLVYLLKEFLKEKGFNIEFIPDSDFADESALDSVISEYIDNRVEAARDKSKISIQEVRTNRESTNRESKSSDLVSLDTAKFLKLYGYSEPCEYYYLDKELPHLSKGLYRNKYELLNNNSFDEFIYSAPTIEAADKFMISYIREQP